jgi:hypothetical protein
MVDVQKTDATTVCNRCGGVMKIQRIEPLLMEPTMMQHSFACESCEAVAAFKFEKSRPGG